MKLDYYWKVKNSGFYTICYICFKYKPVYIVSILGTLNSPDFI